jgi:hypothetical protein
MFMEEGTAGYQAACAAAIQNIHLAAHSFGLGSLWFTLFDKKALRDILEVDEAKKPCGTGASWKTRGWLNSYAEKKYKG